MAIPSHLNGTSAYALLTAVRTIRQSLAFCAYALAASILCGVWTPWLALANPTGEQVTAGQGSFNRNGSTLTVTQGTDRMIVNWQDFSISPWETTRFIQPSVTSAALNRVVGGNPSNILGTLQANGSLYLINPNGIVVGTGARIDAGSFLASTLDISDSQFMAGGAMNFLGPSTASVQNLGVINATNGDVILIGQEVINHGEINAPNGTAGLAAGNDIVLMPANNSGAEGRLSVRVKESDLGIRKREKGVTNTGKINAATAELKAAGGNVYALAINNTGTVRANSLQNRGGRIFLSTDGGKIVNKGTLQAKGGRVVVNSASRNRTRAKGSPGSVGVTEMGGVVDVSNRDAGQKGGTVQVLGDQILVSKNARIDASGFSGGEILVGGDFQGANADVVNAEMAFIDAGAELRADSTGSGDGGKIIVWSDMRTVIGAATLSAKGGPEGGNGGLIETSGKHTLVFAPREATTAAQHPSGAGGTILLDPDDIDITGPGIVDPFFNPVYFGYSSGTETYLNTTIESLGGNIILQAKNNININAPLNFPQDFNYRIVFQAGNQINVNANITTQGADLYLEANSPYTILGGNPSLNIGPFTINTNGGDLHLNGATYTVDPSAFLSAHIIFFGPGEDGNSMSILPAGFPTIPDSVLNQINAGSTTFGGYDTAGPLGDLAGSDALYAGFLSIGNSTYPASAGTITYYAKTQISLASGVVNYNAPVFFNPIGSPPFKFNPGDTINSTSDVTFNTPVLMGAPGNAYINTNGGNITFNHLVDGYASPGDSSFILDAGSGDITFYYTVGNAVRLGTLQITDAGDVTFKNNVRVDNLFQSSGTGTTTFDGDIDVMLGSLIISTANISVQKLIEVWNGDITFNHSGTLQVDGLGDMLADSFTDFGGATTFGPGSRLDVLDDVVFASSSLTLNGADIDAGLSISARSTANFYGSTLLNAGGIIFFANSVSGPGSLTANSDSTIVFAGTPGSSLADVQLTARNILINQGINAGNATFNHLGFLHLGGNSIFTGKLTDNGSITKLEGSLIRANGGATFNSIVNIASPLIIDTSAGSGGIQFNGPVLGSDQSLALLAGSGNITVSYSTDLGALTLLGNQVYINQSDAIELAGANATSLNLVTDGAITQTEAIHVNKLTMSAGSTITLTNVNNKIAEIGDITRGGDVNIFEDPGLIISGQINRGNLQSNVTIVSMGGDLTLAEGANIAVDGSLYKVTLATDGYIFNEAGPDVFTLTNGAVFNLYAGSDLHTDLGGLSTDFVKYGTTYPADDNTIPPGNGIFYANSFSTSVNNPNNAALDNFMDGAISQLDSDQPEIDFDTDAGMGLLGDGLGDFTNYDSVVDREESIVMGNGIFGQIQDKYLPEETKDAIDPNVESQLANAMGTGEPNPSTGASPGKPTGTAPGEAPGLMTKGDSATIDSAGITRGGPVPQETNDALNNAAEGELEKAMVQATGLDGTPFDQVLGNQENSVLDGTTVNSLPAAQVPPELTGATTDSIEQELTSAMNANR